MRPLLAITAATIRQILGLRRAILSGLALLVPAGVFLLTSQTLSDEAALDRFIFMLISLYFPLIVPIVTLIFSASALGDERRDGTLSFLVVRPIPRSTIAAAKIVGAVLVAVVLNAIGGAALAIVYGLETGSWSILLPLVLGGAAASIIYGSVFVLLGFFTDRAVVIGLLYVLIFETAVFGALSGLHVLSPWRTGLAVFWGFAPTDVAAELSNFGPADPMGLSRALLLTAIVAIASVAATTTVLRRRDLA
ncbi:MAG: ABC transporter permease subunit [Actinomycetota bacterium]